MQYAVRQQEDSLRTILCFVLLFMARMHQLLIWLTSAILE